MCIEVLVKKPSETVLCLSVGELAKALGVRAKHVSPDPWKFCLCNAYLDKLGAREPTEDEGYPGMTVVIDVEK